MADQGAHPAVIGAGRAAALNVAENGHAGIFAQPFFQNPTDVVAADAIAGPIGGAFGHHHDTVAATRRPAMAQQFAHAVFPALRRGIFGNQHVVGAAGDGAGQRQIAAMPAHDLDHETALVAGGRAGQRIDGFDDAVQGGIGADGHVGADHVVVDGAHQPGDHQRRVSLGGGFIDFPGLNQLRQQFRPLLTKQIGAGQAAVAADDHQPIDATLEQIASGASATLPLTECRAAGGADDGTAPMQDAADIVPRQRADAIATVHHALIAFENGVDGGALMQRGADHRAYRGVHALGIAAAGQDADAGWEIAGHGVDFPSAGERGWEESLTPLHNRRITAATPGTCRRPPPIRSRRPRWDPWPPSAG